MQPRAFRDELILLFVGVVRTVEIANHRHLMLENLKPPSDMKHVHVKENIVSCLVEMLIREFGIILRNFDYREW